MRSAEPSISRPLLKQLDISVDNFWAETLEFPADFERDQGQVYKKALDQIRLGIRDGGCGCPRNELFLDAAQYSALAETVFWCKDHNIDFPWLHNPIREILKDRVEQNITKLKTWNFQVATALPSDNLGRKQALPLQLPPSSLIENWPRNLFPTQGDLSRHIKKQVTQQFTDSLTNDERSRFQAVARQTVKLHPKSILQSSSNSASVKLWQCSTSLFALTSFYELSNEALVNSSALLLGAPIPHARYLQAHSDQYANIDLWGDFLLNDPAHAGVTRKNTHDKLAQELTKIANESGLPTTCKESHLPYRDEGRPDRSRKRADMMTWGGGAVGPNIRLNFTKNTRLIMDVTIGHIYNSEHKYKRKNLQTMETRKRGKYSQYYLPQRLAFAPIVANTIGQCGPDFLQFLWILADQAAKTQSGSNAHDNFTMAMEDSQVNIDYRRIRGRKYHEHRLRILTCVFEAITERILGMTYDLSNTESYRQWVNMHRHNWQPEIPSYDLPSQEMDSTSPSSAETLSEVEQMQDNIVIDQQLTASYNPTQPLEQEITRTLSEGASCEDWQDSMETAASMDVHTGDQRIAMTYQRKRRSVKSMDPNDQSSDANPRPSQRRRNCTYIHPPTHHTP